MTTPSLIPRPWSHRQREVLSALVRQAAARAEQEKSVQAEFTTRTAAIDRDAAEAEARMEEQYRAKRAKLDADWQERKQLYTAEYQQHVSETSEVYYQHKNTAKTDYLAA